MLLNDDVDPTIIGSAKRLNQPLGTVTENLSAAYRKGVALDSSESERTMRSDVWADIVDTVNERQGTSFVNPSQEMPTGLFSHITNWGRNGPTNYQLASSKIIDYIQQNQATLGDLSWVTEEEVSRRAQERALKAYKEFGDIEGRSFGFGSTVAQFAGGFGAAAMDPTNVATLFLGGAPGKTAAQFTGFLFREAAINAGTEAVTQVSVADWYKKLGLKYSWEDFVNNVALAGAFGAGLPLGFRIGGQVTNLTIDQAKKGIEVLRGASTKPPSPEARTADRALDFVENDIKSNPLDTRKEPFFAESEHAARIEAATAAVENGAIPRMSDDPGAPIRPPKSVYDADNLDGGLYAFNPKDIGVDARTFQFKEGGDEFGVTDRLQGVTRWDPIKAGLVTVYEFADGRRFIADGHQRLGLAKRIQAADPSQDVRVHGHLLREADGITPEMARVIAAVKNIAEGTGTAIDAAKVLRDAPERAGELPPRSVLVKQATALTQLSDEAFGAVINGLVPANYAAIVGRLIPDEGLQQNAMGILAKMDPANEFQAEAIVRDIREAGGEQMRQEGLFGEELITESYFSERAKILDRAQKQLRQDKAAFANLVTNAERLQSEGNKLANDANQRRATNDAQAIALLQAAATRRGPISDALTAAARQARETGGYSGPTQGFLDVVRRAIDEGDFNRLAAGDFGRELDVTPQGRAGADEAELDVDGFDQPGGAGIATQADQLEQDLFGGPAQPREVTETMQEDVVLRQQLNDLIDQKAADEVIDSHPAVTRAIEEAKAIPETHLSEGYLSDTWIETRPLRFGEEEVLGYQAGITRLYEEARTLAWRDDGLDVPPNPTRYENRAIIVIGPPAAGKSSIANPIARKMGAAIIDGDEAKKILPEYNKGIGAAAVHEESSYLSSLLEQVALAQKINVVIPKVGDNPASIKKVIGRLRAAGYEIDLVDMVVPYGEARLRMYKRFVNTGRLIPPDYVKAVGDKPTQTYDLLKKEGAVDGYTRLDNRGAADQPKPVYEDTRQLLEGTDIRLSSSRGESGAIGARGSQPETGAASLGELETQQSLTYPTDLRVNVDTGEVEAVLQTAGQMRAEFAQDRKMLDRLRGCVK